MSLQDGQLKVWPVAVALLVAAAVVPSALPGSALPQGSALLQGLALPELQVVVPVHTPATERIC